MRFATSILVLSLTTPAYATTKADLPDLARSAQELLIERFAVDHPDVEARVDGSSVVLLSENPVTLAEVKARYPSGARVSDVRVDVIADRSDALARLGRQLEKLDVQKPRLHAVNAGPQTIARIYAHTEADRRRILERFGRDYFGLPVRYDLMTETGELDAERVHQRLVDDLQDAGGVTKVFVDTVDGVGRVVIVAADQRARTSLRHAYAEGMIQGVPVEIVERGPGPRAKWWDRCQTWLGDLQSKVGGI